MSHFIVRLAAACLAVAASLPAHAQSPDITPTQKAGVERVVQDMMRKRNIPGLQVAVVRHGHVAMLGAYGIANLQDGVRVTDDTVFSINSATKSFTGVAIMQLVEDGKLALDAPVSRYLDGLPAAWQPVTIRQLLTHTSGLPDILVAPTGQGTGSLVGDGSEASAWATVQAMPMETAPGTRSRYNQTNYVILGKLIDKYSGEPFVDFIRHRQFDVAGMPTAMFGDSRDVVPHRAQPYRYPGGAVTVSGTNGKLHHAFDEFTPFIRTGAGLNASARDVAAWIVALEQGKLLRKPGSLDMLWTRGKLNDGKDVSWALGWPTRARDAHPVVAGIGGRRSAFFVYPKDDLAIVVLTNLAGAAPEDFIDEIAGQFHPELLAENGGGLSPAIHALRTAALKQGYDALPAIADAQIARDATLKPGEDDLNMWGGRLMQDGELPEAIAVFALATHVYPRSANTWDSLAEANEAAGKRNEAIRFYRKSLALDPGNHNAQRHLAGLGAM
jgi:CubicO group peptidase (beta-lactamase class C family)